MKNLVATIALIASVNSFAAVNYSASVELPTSASQIKLASAEYQLIPTKTIVRTIPGCVETPETYGTCTTTVVLESEGAVVAHVSYLDLQFSEPEVQWVSVNLKTDSFSPEAVTALKAASPAWRFPFSKVRAEFAKNNLSASVKTISKDIQVIDMRNSKICQRNDDGEILGNCSDVLVYKTAKTSVKEVSVLKK